MWRSFVCVLGRDITLAMRRRTEALTTLFFFVIVVSLFPLGVGTQKETLRMLGPGVVWVAALLASMLALERLFAADYEDGTLEQLLMTAQPLPLLVLAKVAAHWLLTGLPLVFIAPLVGLQYHMGNSSVLAMILSLLVGTPVLSLIGAIGAALTLGVRGGESCYRSSSSPCMSRYSSTERGRSPWGRTDWRKPNRSSRCSAPSCCSH